MEKFQKGIDFCHDKKRGGKLSPGTGRPTNEPKGYRESFRLSDDDMRKLHFCMEYTGMTKTDIIRKEIDLVYKEISK